MVDFIDLATLSHDIIRRHLSYLDTSSSDEDDDFAELSSSRSSSSSSSSSQYGYHDPPTSSNRYDTDSSNTMSEYYHMVDAGKQPFLSKSAETELYLLATNFLLYVAMVIITIMVAKIYFPESLQRGRGRMFDPSTGSTYNARNYSYIRSSEGGAVDATTTTTGAGGEGGITGVGSGSADGLQQRQNFFNNNNTSGDDNGEILDSDGEGEDEDGEDEVESLLFNKGDNTNNNTTSSSSSGGRRGGRTTFLDFDPERTAQNKVFQRLMFCCIMLNVTFVTWGVLQERMLTRRYPRYVGDYFTYSYALVFTNRFWTMVLSGILLTYLKPRLSRTTVLYEYTFPSISNMLSSWCQYEALRYVSFPATTLFKSFKLAPVMLMGKILGNKTYPQYDYVVALIIGVGIALFMSSTDDLSWGKDYLGVNASEAWTGVMLLFLFLFFDSFTSQFQSRMFQRHADLSMVELMFATSAFSTVLSAITLVHTKELYSALEFVVKHTEIHVHFFMFSICSTIGQLLIFYTIKNFGAVVFTLIMTTRILLSIALSCFMYGHHITGTGFMGLMFVLGAVLYRIKKKAEGKQLVKWQGMEDDKGPELVQEWHEHVDM